MDFKFW